MLKTHILNELENINNQIKNLEEICVKNINRTIDKNLLDLLKNDFKNLNVNEQNKLLENISKKEILNNNYNFITITNDERISYLDTLYKKSIELKNQLNS
jgi:hypothetical protein